MIKTPSIMTYLLDSKGEKVKVYDLHKVFYPEYAHYDRTGKLISNIYNCRPFGCECGSPQGMEVPFDEAKEAFDGLRKEMRYHLQELANWVYFDGKELTLAQREFEPRRLDMVGYTSSRLYKAWLTHPSKKHRLGQVRSDVYRIPDGVKYKGNGEIVFSNGTQCEIIT